MERPRQRETETKRKKRKILRGKKDREKRRKKNIGRENMFSSGCIIVRSKRNKMKRKQNDSNLNKMRFLSFKTL